MTRGEIVCEVMREAGYTDEKIREQQAYAESMMPGNMNLVVPPERIEKERAIFRCIVILAVLDPDRILAMRDDTAKRITESN